MANQEKFNHQLHVEHELINRKLTWLLSSQSILFAALAFVLGKEVPEARQVLFFQVVSWLGIGISVLILVGVCMAVVAKVASWRDYNRQVPTRERVPLGVRTWVTVLALAPDMLMPLAFVVAWGCLRAGM